MNPRLECWLVSRGEDPAQFVPTAPGDDCPLVVDPVDGGLYPRPLVFMLWVQARWREWATGLGFKRGVRSAAHERALASGHTHGEFDAWLRARVRP